MSRIDEIKARHQKKQDKLGFQKLNPSHNNELREPENKIKKSFNSNIIKIIIVSIVILLVAAIVIIVPQNNNIEDYEKAVGVVVITSSFESLMHLAIPWLFDEDQIESSGNQIHIPIATTFSIGEGKFVTNAHVTEQLHEVLSSGGEAYVKLNKSSNYIFPVEKVISHPNYNDKNFDEFDVGLIYVQGDVPYSLKLEKKSNLKKLKAGDEIIYIGFPMENLPNGGLNLGSLVATVQVGNVTAVSDYKYKVGRAESNYLVRHNLGATGGASGSPIINKKGNVVAVLNAITVEVPSDETTAKQSGAAENPSAVMINYAQRADLINDIKDNSNFFK